MRTITAMPAARPLGRERVALPADTGVDMQQVEAAGPEPSRHGVRIVVEPFDRGAETGATLQQSPAAGAHRTGQGHVVTAAPLSCQGEHVLADAGRLHTVRSQGITGAS